ncbi:protein-disulfide reductase [Oceanidesulfovibrio indonesiensis]|uniref:Protein-disulfide reductase n=1 Tax=Oceanidesulfovibrio indonesiensis TaxID=54767 RepID=A0A7M3MG35_9BACT|nr:cytochrome c biogenesis protein CcdA [Oceanidesulfovibrio indonesiensis]TVM18283.1 protein-disulfide reductase [Oceanidesulfovibrio indonesiensis]
MKKSFVLAIFLICACLAGHPAISDAQMRAPVEAHWELYSRGDDGLLGVLLVTPEEGSYIYGHEKGPTGLPTTLGVNTFPDGLAGEVVYPKGEMKPDTFDPELIVPVYDVPTRLFVPLRKPDGNELTVAGRLEGLSCTDKACFPLKMMVEATFDDVATASAAAEQPWWPEAEPLLAGVDEPAGSDIGRAQPTTPADTQPATAQPAEQEQVEDAVAWDFSPRFLDPHLEVTSLAKALLLAILAGLILNVMPCVLPVVSLKLSSIVAVSSMEAHSERLRYFREHNIFFAAGILVYFMVLGGVLGSLGMAWGELFQSQSLVLVLALVVFALGLSLFGVYDLPIVDLKTGHQLDQNPRSQAFFTGLMATLLATPCSGPFLGGVLGWVLSQGPAVIVLVFIAIGVGMSLPYLLMAVSPRLVHYFPKPGRWNVHLERIVGFFLMGTTIYLLAILSESLQTRGMVALLITALGAWIWGQWTSLSDSPSRRMLVRTLAAVVVIGGVLWTLYPRENIRWPELELAEFREDLGRQAMMLDFTADWCPNCKALEAAVLTDSNLQRWERQYGLRFYKVDLTLHDPWEMELLESLGSKSIPVVAVFPTGEGAREPLVLRDIFTTGQMEEALEEMFR